MALPESNLGYRYETLPGPQSIRLLTIHPARNITDSIECSIETVDLLAEKDKYDAISYSWGMDPDGSGEACLLTLDGTPFSITQNLWDGMKRIRLCKGPVRIWIDALCINQNDDPEKSVQVAMMADIYAGAESVHIWLGEGNDASEDKLFLDVLKQMEERAARVRPWTDPTHRHQNCFVFPLLGKGNSCCPGCVAERREGSTVYRGHVDWMSKWFVSDSAEGHNAAKSANLGIKFFSRRYWKRRWILQELAFAKRQLLYWGGCLMDVSELPKDWLDDFTQAVWMIVNGLRGANEALHTPGSDHSAFDVYPLRGGSSTIMRLGGLSQFCTPQTDGYKRKPTWNWCLQKFHSSECSDPRDMYYALASMIEPRIRVDYTLTQAEVFINFAKTMLGLGEWVWVFYCAARRVTDADQVRNTDTLPTWVPDPRLVNFHYGGTLRPMGIQILEGNALLCTVRCLHSKAHGDIVCSCQEEPSHSDVWLILRPSNSASQTYTLVGVSETMPRRDSTPAWDFSNCPKINVRII